jgi:hypothetical protein
MSADGAIATRPGRPWKPGQSGNPGGLSKVEAEYRAKVRAALHKQESPKEICEVVAAMRKDAVSHTKRAAPAARVYLEAVGLKGITLDTLDEKVQQGVRAEMERLLTEAEQEMAREPPIDVTPVKP